LATIQVHTRENETFRVVHPLHDEPETKLSTSGLEPMRMTRSVRISLITLRAYLVVMTLMLLYHAFDLAGLFHK
jgi:hypothetical protein